MPIKVSKLDVTICCNQYSFAKLGIKEVYINTIIHSSVLLISVCGFCMLFIFVVNFSEPNPHEYGEFTVLEAIEKETGVNLSNITLKGLRPSTKSNQIASIGMQANMAAALQKKREEST